MFFFFFSSRRRHTRSLRDWSSDVCSSDLPLESVVACLSSLVSSLTMVIFTPATTPPCESVTVPAIRPKMLWAAAVSTTQAVNSTANVNAAVFNAMLRNAPFQTTWFDLDTFVLTGTPPSKKWTPRPSPIPFWPASFSLPTPIQPGHQRKIPEDLRHNAARTALRDGISLTRWLRKKPDFRRAPSADPPTPLLRAQLRAAHLRTPVPRIARSRPASPLGRSPEFVPWSGGTPALKRSSPQTVSPNGHVRPR